jgi:hypothetical protein
MVAHGSCWCFVAAIIAGPWSTSYFYYKCAAAAAAAAAAAPAPAGAGAGAGVQLLPATKSSYSWTLSVVGSG